MSKEAEKVFTRAAQWLPAVLEDKRKAGISMGKNVYDAYVWAKENVPTKDASDAEWEDFARKAIDFCETYRGGDDSEYRAVSAIIVQRCDAVFEGVPIIQGPLELD